MKQKKGQIAVTFNWVYVLIAGAIILLFFAGVIVKQKASAEERLEGEIVRVMDSILVGAEIAESQKDFVDVSGLESYILEFKCEGDYSVFGIKGGASVELPTRAIFAPKEIRTTTLILWSLPYELPYKVADLLMVSSVNTKYFIVGGEGTAFRSELEKTLDFSTVDDEAKFNYELVSDINYDTIVPGNNFHVTVVYLDPVNPADWGNIPAELDMMEPERLSAVDVSGGEITFYKKEVGSFKWKEEGAVPLVSLGEERDAAKYVAIFAGDKEGYECGMKKAFRRMELVNEVYEGKLEEMKTYYGDSLVLNQPTCQHILEGQDGSVEKVFGQLKEATSSCVAGSFGACNDIIGFAASLKDLNKELSIGGCIGLY